MARGAQKAGSQATASTALYELRIVYTGGDEARFTEVSRATGDGAFLCVTHAEKMRVGESAEPVDCSVTTFIPSMWIREAELVTPLPKPLKDLK